MDDEDALEIRNTSTSSSIVHSDTSVHVSLSNAAAMTNPTALEFDSTPPSSTPLRDNAVFSDEPTRCNTPPSSPPGFPWERLNKQDARDLDSLAIAAPPPKPQKNAFSLLGKRKVLDPIAGNARPKKQQKAACESGSKAGTLTQMQMSLGQEVQKKCKQCGMEYTASSAEDRKLHDKFHKQSTEGYDLGKDFVKQTDRRLLVKMKSNRDAILRVNCFDKHHRQKKAQAALEIVQRELGAVPIPEAQIWGKEAMREGLSNNLEPKFDAFLYVRGAKCVGFVLAERIEEAFEVVRPDAVVSKTAGSVTTDGRKSALAALTQRKLSAAQELAEAEQHPIQLSTKPSPAVMGISRIWTSPTHRGQGIARSLLDAAVAAHNARHATDMSSRERLLQEAAAEEPKGVDCTHKRILADDQLKTKKIDSKDQVAFSQPTESGAKLARKWVGKAYGWRVYVD